MIRVLLLLTACLPTGAMACAVTEDFLPTDLTAAPVVVTATVTGFHQRGGHVGVMTADVTGVLKGAAPATPTLEWSPDLSEWPPEDGDRETGIILAAVPHGSDRAWQLAVESCGSAWVLPDTTANRATVGAAVNADGAG